MHVVLAIDGLGSGGAQRQVVELALRLARRPDLRCSVLCYHPDSFYDARLAEGGLEPVRILRRGRGDLGWVGRVARWLASERVDLVHAFLLTPSLWMSVARRLVPAARRPRLVVAERNSRIATSPREALLQRLVYRHCDAVTVNASPVAAMIHARLGVPEARIHYLPNGIDLTRWDREAGAPSPLPTGPDAFDWGLIGGLRPQKGHTVLFDALQRLGPETTRGWRVWCVGGRTAGEAAARHVEEELARRGLGDVVRLCPPQKDVAALLRGLDALVLPSWYEGFPNVVLEAMASRRPVVATSVGDVPALVAHGESGLRVPPGDARALAEAMATLAALPTPERRRMGESGRKRVEERFRIEEVAARHAELYASLRKGG